MTDSALKRRTKNTKPSFIRELVEMFSDGDTKTRLGFLIMGFGSLLRGQIIKGM
ncbi:MAG: sugar ABC transporter permease, partial [Clostridiales bacterium]|nr:sugar ABC transporter permease [Clostridiales bacterium]